MLQNDPFIVMPRDALTKIKNSDLSRGKLTLRRAPADDMYVIEKVEIATEVRIQVDIPRIYTALRSGDSMHVGQWFRLESSEAHINHLLFSRRPTADIGFEYFRTLVQGIDDPGEGLGIAITHTPDLSPELVEARGSEFAAWTIRRSGVRPLQIEVEPETIGLQQLAGKWPIDELADNSVLVVGCGSIGSAAVDALAGYGIGHVELLDPDRFLWQNMIRHTLGPESVGRYKTRALKEYLRQHWPQQSVNSHQLDVVTDSHYVQPLIEKVDLVLCTADGIAPRRVISHLARRSNTPAVLSCVIDGGAVGEIIRLRPTPKYGCLLCLRSFLADAGAMDVEADQELDYGTGQVHQPMTAVPPDLKFVGTFAAKIAVATLLESLHGDHTQRIPGEYALIGLQPKGDLAEPFDLKNSGDLYWSSIPEPREFCATCSEV